MAWVLGKRLHYTTKWAIWGVMWRVTQALSDLCALCALCTVERGRLPSLIGWHEAHECSVFGFVHLRWSFCAVKCAACSVYHKV